MIARLKAAIWVNAQVRICNQQSLPIYVLHRGDPDAGIVLIKLVLATGQAMILSPLRQSDESLAWLRATGPDPVAETDADVYIERQRDFDPDIWVVEIENHDGAWQPNEPIVD